MGGHLKAADPKTMESGRHSLDIHSLHMSIFHERRERAGKFLNDDEDIDYLIFAFKRKIQKYH